MKKNFGVIKKVIDPDLFTVEVDIPGENEALRAFPKRGEVDEPRVGDVVWLEEVDPLYHSYYLYEKLKENNFIGIRARGKVLRLSSDEISVGIFDPSNESWYDKQDGADPTPEPTSWIKLDKDGNIDINGEKNTTINIKGNVTINVDGDAKIDVKGNAETNVGGDSKLTVSGDTEIKSPNVKINSSSQVQITGGGSFNMRGTASPSVNGPMNCLKMCVFSGAVHGSDTCTGI